MRLSFLMRFLLFVFCLLPLTACTPSVGGTPFAYAEASFSLSVEGTYLPANDPHGTPRPFSAEIAVGAPHGGDPTLRGLTLTCTSPPSLAGVTVTADYSPTPDGNLVRRIEFAYSSDYGTVHATIEGSAAGFLRFAEGWLPFGDITDVSPKAPDGSYTVTRQSANREAVFTFDGGNLPTGVTISDAGGCVVMKAK